QKLSQAVAPILTYQSAIAHAREQPFLLFPAASLSRVAHDCLSSHSLETQTYYREFLPHHALTLFLAAACVFTPSISNVVIIGFSTSGNGNSSRYNSVASFRFETASSTVFP